MSRFERGLARRLPLVAVLTVALAAAGLAVQSDPALASGSVDRVIATIPGQDQPFGVAVSPAGPAAGEVYVVDTIGDTMSVIDPETNTVAQTIALGDEFPIWAAVAPIGPQTGDVYVTNSGGGTVSVIDPSAGKIVQAITVGSGPSGVAVAPAGLQAGDCT